MIEGGFSQFEVQVDPNQPDIWQLLIILNESWDKIS